MLRLWLGVLTSCAAAAAHADLLVERGHRATLAVDYALESTGANPGDLASQEWKVRRTLSTSVVLEAAPPLPIGQMRAPDAEQTAALNAQAAAAEQAAAALAPQMPGMLELAANAEALAAKCGDNEECFMREMQSLISGGEAAALGAAAGQAMSGLESAPQAPRYQVWRQVQQLAGSYSIDETLETRSRDPACDSQPNDQCIMREVRKGGGTVPGKQGDGPAAFEIDTQGKTLVMLLPFSPVPLAYTRTFTSTHPEDEAFTGEGVLGFPGALELPESHVSPRISVGPALQPLTLAVSGDALPTSGTHTLEARGEMNERVTLTIAWRLAVQ